MIIYPAIDLKDGQCVRLQQGDFTKKTVYNENPVKQALEYQNKGAEYLHLVDLDGARDGYSKNIEAIKEIIAALSIPIQLGGGLRTEKDIKSMLDLGITRVILGTKAVENPNFIRDMIQKYPKQIVVSIDAINGYVATQGWLIQSEVKALDLAGKLQQNGLKTLVYTDISKDGMMQGINHDFYSQLKEQLHMEIIASGGITNLEDIIALQEKNIDGAIIGNALYLKRIRLEDALEKAHKNERK